MVKDLPAVQQKDINCGGKDENKHMDTNTPVYTREPAQHVTQSQAATGMSVRRSTWEPSWGPVFKNKEHFVEMHLC